MLISLPPPPSNWNTQGLHVELMICQKRCPPDSAEYIYMIYICITWIRVTQKS